MFIKSALTEIELAQQREISFRITQLLPTHLVHDLISARVDLRLIGCFKNILVIANTSLLNALTEYQVTVQSEIVII